METSINKTKKELINWIENLDDPYLLSKLLEIKENNKAIPLVSEHATDYEIKNDFEERWKNGLTAEQAKAESIRRIREWWGK